MGLEAIFTPGLLGKFHILGTDLLMGGISSYTLHAARMIVTKMLSFHVLLAPFQVFLELKVS